MIRNDHQYQVTLERVAAFEQALTRLNDAASENPQMVAVQQDAIRSQLDDFTKELDDYRALLSGKQRRFKAASLDELPALLIKARIAAGLSEQQLATMVGLDAQQLGDNEDMDFDSTSFAVLLDIAEALGVSVTLDASLPGTTRRQVVPQPLEHSVANGHLLGFPKMRILSYAFAQIELPLRQPRHILRRWYRQFQRGCACGEIVPRHHVGN